MQVPYTPLTVLLTVDNDRTWVSGADITLLKALDQCMRYPTPFAEAPDVQKQDPEEGKEEEKSSQSWDGWMRMLRIPKTLPPWFPTGLLSQVQNLLQGWGIQSSTTDRRKRPDPGIPEPADLQLYDYQEEAVAEAMRVGYGVIDMPPRSGKTRISLELARRIALPGVYIAPTDGIVTQTLDVYDRFMGKNYARHLIGSDWKAVRNAPMVLCTAATAVLLPDEFWAQRQVLQVDEFHHCLSGSTLVDTETGLLPIQDVVVGDRVWSSGPKGLELREVVNHWIRKAPGTWLRLETEVGVLEVTDEHEIYTPEGRVKASELRAGGSVCVACGTSSSARVGSRPAVGAARIIGIRRVPSSSLEVHDLEVREFHNYFAGGVLVSNSASKSYRSVFQKCAHMYHRYGFTGTFYRSGTDAMAMYALLSTVIYRVTAQEMLDRGRLVPMEVLFCPVQTKHLRGLPSKSYIEGHGKFGIHENLARNQLVVRFARGLLSLGHQVLVLVGTRAQGQLIHDDLAQELGFRGNRRVVEFVHSKRHRQQNLDALEAFRAGGIGILIGTSLLGEGIDLPNAGALVYARGEKAAVALRQYSYRVCTASEGKSRAILVDFADRHHRKLLQHAQERLRLFFEEPTCRVKVGRSEDEVWDFIRSGG